MFSLIKAWIDKKEMNSRADFDDPVALIHEAFLQFAVDGPQAHSVRGCWNIYFNLFANYLANDL